jgi:serine/threonine protein phosphatase PrpC
MTINVRETRPIDIEYYRKGERKIDSFVLTQFDGETGLKYSKKLQKILIPVMVEYFDKLEKHKADAQAIKTVDEDGNEVITGYTISPEVIKSIAKIASEKLDELEFEDVKSMICIGASIPPSEFSNRFMGKTVVIYKLLKEIVLFNFEDVFTELGLDEI